MSLTAERASNGGAAKINKIFVYWNGNFKEWLNGFLNYGQGRQWKTHFLMDSGKPSPENAKEFDENRKTSQQRKDKLRAFIKQ